MKGTITKYEREIFTGLIEIREGSRAVEDGDDPRVRDRIQEIAESLVGIAREAREWSWRNQR